MLPTGYLFFVPIFSGLHFNGLAKITGAIMRRKYCNANVVAEMQPVLRKFVAPRRPSLFLSSS
ncbi:hypothetical protein PBI_SHEPARD_43 [Arthrobacter phage Shepard]|nr:hypothetical protein PBI_SHEPARD_43 [Arthrobacter phage Shepard]